MSASDAGQARLPVRRAALLLVALLQGCAPLAREEELAKSEDYFARLDTLMQGQEQRTIGAIYAPSAASFLRGDRRARNVGDILTVQLVERTTGSSLASNEAKRNASHSVTLSAPLISAAGGIVNSVTDLLLSERRSDEISDGLEGVLGDNSIGTNHQFAGSGRMQKSNEMNGFVTVTVERVFPNGNLFITGQKRVETDGGDEFVRLRGIIRPDDVTPQNTVLSTRVAEAEIGFVGAGDRQYAAREGWLGRFFNRVDPL